jgi:hypothetical protein
VWFDFGTDLDGDTYSYEDLDCNDYDAAIGPDAEEIWYDGVDQDCDENDDDRDWDASPWPLDCNDDDHSIHPGAEEIWYDGVDQNCDENDDDRDGDASPWPLDCNDDDASIHPGAEEIRTDGIDQDCDGHDIDIDGDGFLTAVNDCNDRDPAINPDATEVCGPDDVDEDCDGAIDDEDSETVPFDWYIDNDGDGYGRNRTTPLVTCETVAGRATRSGDCNDSRANIHPGARDIANDGIDQDCNGRDRVYLPVP